MQEVYAILYQFGHAKNILFQFHVRNMSVMGKLNILTLLETPIEDLQPAQDALCSQLWKRTWIMQRCRPCTQMSFVTWDQMAQNPNVWYLFETSSLRRTLMPSI